MQVKLNNKVRTKKININLLTMRMITDNEETSDVNGGFTGIEGVKR